MAKTLLGAIRALREKVPGLFTTTLAILVISTGLALAGIYNFPTTTLPLTGVETIPADTNLSGGRTPQTEIISVKQLQSLREGAITYSASITPNYSTYNYQTVTLAGNTIVSAPSANPPGSMYVYLKITQGSTGSYTATWNSIYEWPNPGTAPTLITTGNAADLIRCLFDNGTTKYLCTISGTNGYTP